VLSFEKGLHDNLKTSHADLIKRIEDTKDLSKDDEGALRAAIESFKKSAASDTTGQRGAGARAAPVKEQAMAGMKEIRGKIKSVQNTRKITKAMEMVAASKMRKAQERMRAARPYADKVRNIAAHMGRANPEYRTRSWWRTTAQAAGIIVVTTDKGLCGGLNTNVLRATVQKFKELEERGQKVEATAIGSKGLGFLNRFGAKVVSQSYTSATPRTWTS
jgi:F-type H+-transporting ATPase subunit gamma